MKLTRSDLESLNVKLSTENEALTLALNDLCEGKVKWFGNSRTYAIGISRPNGAAGGICIVRQSGMTYAYYFERYARETLEHISRVITGTKSEHNAHLLRERAAIEAAQAYVSESQRTVAAPSVPYPDSPEGHEAAMIADEARETLANLPLI